MCAWCIVGLKKLSLFGTGEVLHFQKACPMACSLHVYSPAPLNLVVLSQRLVCHLFFFLRAQIAGTPNQTLTALKMITDKLRAVSSAPPELDRGHPDRHREYGGGSPVDKRSRGDGPPPGERFQPSVMLQAAQVVHRHMHIRPAAKCTKAAPLCKFIEA